MFSITKRLKQVTAAVLLFFSFNASAAEIFASDLDISLFHNGILVAIFDGANDFTFTPVFDVTFDDESANAHNGSAPYTSDMQSFNLLSAFDGQDINGVWELRILDVFFPGEGDELVSWEIFGFTGLTALNPFSYGGPGASNVDSNPYTSSFINVQDFGDINDLNVRVVLNNVQAPEPGALALLTLALAVLGGTRKYSKKS